MPRTPPPLRSAALLALALAACGRSPATQSERGPAPPAAQQPPAPPAEAAPPAPMPGPEDRARGIAALRQGREMARAGDVRGAERAFREAARVLPPFRGAALLLAAEAAAAAGDTASVRRLVDEADDETGRDRGWRVRADALRRAGDAAGALAAADRAAPGAPTPAWRAEAWQTAGALRLEAGDAAAALAAFRRAMAVAPSSTAARDAARAAAEMPGLAPEDRLLAGRTLLAHGGVDRGVAGLEAYLAAGRGTEAERAAVHLEAGRALFAARRNAAAEPHLLAAAGSSGEAATLAGRAQLRRGREAQARETWRAAAGRFRGQEAAAEALFFLGDLEQDAGRAAPAREFYRQAVASGAHGPAAAEAAQRLAGLAVLGGDAAGALRDLDAYLAGRPRDALAAPALYWAGRAHLLAGHGEAARRRFREAREADAFSYYGVLAGKRIGESLRGAALAAPPTLEPAVAAKVEAALFRAGVLREIGMEEEGRRELAGLRERMAAHPAALYAVAEAMPEHGQPVAAALLGHELRQRLGRWDERLLRIAFPFRFRDTVEREARRRGLDPFMVAGLIRKESIFNPNAISPVGAVGLMQVMPATGRGLARRAGVGAMDLKDPETNVKLGTLFLADQVRRYRTLTEVFAAYNAGPGRVARWRSFPEYRDEDLFVERIPFEETRDYVKKVKLYAGVYELLYAD